jgi:hypothetical protein
VTAAGGVLLVACAYTGARFELVAMSELFWVGLLLLYVPIVGRLMQASPTPTERLGLLLLLGGALYLVKLLHSPFYFHLADEFNFIRSYGDLIQTGHLFAKNPLNRVIGYYPGLVTTTSSTTALSGLPLFVGGNLVLVALRCVLVLALYLFYAQVSGSARIAGLATALYMANPNFVFFNALFAYESLALPLALLVLATMMWRDTHTGAARFGLNTVLLLLLLMVIITHHVTAWLLTVFLALVALIGLVLRRVPGRVAPTVPVLLPVVLCVAWTIYVATPTAAYILPNLRDLGNELISLLAGGREARQLFHNPAVAPPPLWERLTAIAAVLLILAGLPFGLLALWRDQRTHAVALALGATTMLYPGSLASRLTSNFAAEISNRTLAFAFVGVAFALAYGVQRLWLTPRPVLLHHWLAQRIRWPWRRAAVAVVAAVIFIGGIIGAWPNWARLPGPYMVGADLRSIDTQSLAAAEWMRHTMGEDNRIVTDRTNRLLLASHGRQHAIMSTNTQHHLETWEIILSPTISARERRLLRIGAIRYAIVDRRLADGLPAVGFYFEKSEPDVYYRTEPADRGALTKFDYLPLVSRLFDSGDIRIYDVEVLHDAPPE